MKILLVPDKFKGTYSSREVIDSIQQKNSSHEFDSLIVSDGGDGFLDAISSVQKGNRKQLQTCDPFFEKISSDYFVAEDQTVYFEMALASGLGQLGSQAPNAFESSSFGTGRALRVIAENEKPQRIVLGVGGSATHDLGIGCLEALGAKIFDRQDQILNHVVPSQLDHICRIELPRTLPFSPLVVGYDVDYSLDDSSSPHEAFLPQKGVSHEELPRYVENLNRVRGLIETNPKLAMEKGSGAAGGIGWGLRVTKWAELQSGFEIWANLAGLKEKIREADLVITGEGRIDKSTIRGRKAPWRVYEACKELNRSCLIISGQKKINCEDAIQLKVGQDPGDLVNQYLR